MSKKQYVAKVNYKDEDLSYDYLVLIKNNSFVDNLFTEAGVDLLNHMTSTKLKDSAMLMLMSDIDLDYEVVRGLATDSFFNLRSLLQIDLINQSDIESCGAEYFIKILPVDTNPGLIEAYNAYNEADALLSQFFNN